jgi:hypothetical protein
MNSSAGGTLCRVSFGHQVSVMMFLSEGQAAEGSWQRTLVRCNK